MKTISLETRMMLSDAEFEEELWKLYEAGFTRVLHLSPCRQSFNRGEFFQMLHDEGVYKIIALAGCVVVGLGMKTHDLTKITWLNPMFFQQRFPEEYKLGIGYMLTVVADWEKAELLVGTLIVKEAIRTVPKGSLCCFDFSSNINPSMPILVRRAGKGMVCDEELLDTQKYYCYRRTLS